MRDCRAAAGHAEYRGRDRRHHDLHVDRCCNGTRNGRRRQRQQTAAQFGVQKRKPPRTGGGHSFFMTGSRLSGHSPVLHGLSPTSQPIGPGV